MSSSNQRTWQQYHSGHLLITVQLDPLADQRSVEGYQHLAGVTRQLISLMDEYRVPATWAVSDPAHSAATPLLVRSAVDHELAILGDANWLGPTAGRTRFARELARRVLQARTAGLEVTSLVPRVATIERHIDLVVKQRITAISGLATVSADRSTAAPRALHYGVWEFPTSRQLPLPSHWFFGSGWSTWRQVRRAAQDAATYHLLLDAPAICQEGHRAEKTIARLVRRVAEFRDRGLLSIETLRTASSRLADVPVPSPQQSILRRAA